MKIINELIANMPEGQVLDISVGIHWTAVLMEVNGAVHCGLSSTVTMSHAHGEEVDVTLAGQLLDYSGVELAQLSKSDRLTEASIGVAAINALLGSPALPYTSINAEHVIAQHGKGKNVVVVGHFPFVDRIRKIAARLDVLEQRPQEGDLPGSLAPRVIPQADVLAITAMTIVNHTLDDLLGLCKPEAEVIMVGSSSPLSPVLFEHGVNLICGGIVRNPNAVLAAVRQGACFPQIKKAGVELISLQRSST
jgi:uncharacterized protein (DUF4213/DUF364 family)